TCGYTRGGGYKALAVWDAESDPGKTKQYNAPSDFTRYRDLDGNVSDIAKGRQVSIGAKPILLETGAPAR
ncbi:MAG: hypothetical protein ACRESF_18750, partial [Pseudomonas sp.]